jgi:hypothetical protein
MGCCTGPPGHICCSGSVWQTHAGVNYIPQSGTMNLATILYEYDQFFLQQLTLSRECTGKIGHLNKSNYLCTYDLYSPVYNALDACLSITWGSGRGLGPGISQVFWALWNGNEPIGEFHLGPKKLENSRAQPPPTFPRNGYARRE